MDWSTKQLNSSELLSQKRTRTKAHSSPFNDYSCRMLFVCRPASSHARASSLQYRVEPLVASRHFLHPSSYCLLRSKLESLQISCCFFFFFHSSSSETCPNNLLKLSNSDSKLELYIKPKLPLFSIITTPFHSELRRILDLEATLEALKFDERCISE